MNRYIFSIPLPERNLPRFCTKCDGLSNDVSGLCLEPILEPITEENKNIEAFKKNWSINTWGNWK